MSLEEKHFNASHTHTHTDGDNIKYIYIYFCVILRKPAEVTLSLVKCYQWDNNVTRTETSQF